MSTVDKSLAEGHRAHEAFVRVLDGRRDLASGLRVLQVEYRRTQNYTGGVFVEVYDQNGELLRDSEPATDVDLELVLAEALEEHGDAS